MIMSDKICFVVVFKDIEGKKSRKYEFKASDSHSAYAQAEKNQKLDEVMVFIMTKEEYLRIY